MPNTKLNAVVATKTELSPRLMIMRVVADGWQMQDFKPGQFAVLGLPGSAPRCQWSEPEPEPAPPEKLLRRAYSISSSSMTREFMEFYISLVTDGGLTPRLFSLDVGDHVWLSTKVTGLFTLDQVPQDKNIVMIATGTGLAPYISMLTSELRCGSPRHYAVLHGAYHSWDLGYRSELLSLQHLCHNLDYIATIDRPDEEPVPWSGPVGWVQELWNKGMVADAWGFKPTPANSHVFLCGFSAMIDEMVAILGKEGFREHTPKSPGEIHVERY
jgi:ferredoxin--NADP+ reductase